MFGNPMLDVAIGLAFLYVILSVMITALQEYIAAILKLRSKTLAKGIEELVGSESGEAFFRHPLIFPLFEGGLKDGKPIKGGPSYIPARNFALAVFDLQSRRPPAVAADPSGQSQAPPAFALAEFFLDQSAGTSLKERVRRFDATATGLVANITNPEVKDAASKALGAAVGELKTATDVVNTAVEEIESLFNSTMRRVEGWYKVEVQRYTLAISIVLAVLINADSLYIGQRLWQDDDLRNQTVAAAEAFYANEEVQKQLFTPCGASHDNGQSAQANPAEGLDIVKAAPAPEESAKTPKATQETAKANEAIKNTEKTDSALEGMACAKQKLDAAVEQSVRSAGFPLGWRSEKDKQDGWLQRDQSLPFAILGWIMTGLALSLGSSFWFDVLDKFMKVRQAGSRESSEPRD